MSQTLTEFLWEIHWIENEGEKKKIEKNNKTLCKQETKIPIQLYVLTS